MKTAELYKSLEKALGKMKEALEFPATEPMREATIQRFEYTFELSWKLMSSILKDEGNETFGVKNIIRNAARLGLIDNIERWFEYTIGRNKTSHIYKEKVAKEVHELATGDFSDSVSSLLVAARKYTD